MSYTKSDSNGLISFSTSMRNVTLNQLNVIGEIRTVTAALTGDYLTDFSVANNHIAILINSITGFGNITVTGTSVDESTSLVITGDIETITVDSTPNQHYQTDKKFWDIDSIVIDPGIIAIDYDILVIGYTDLNNSADWKMISYRFDIVASGGNPDIRMKFIKIQDDGDKKMSIITFEDMSLDGNNIIDNQRTGLDDRSYSTGLGAIVSSGQSLVFKQGDLDTFFTTESEFRSSTKHEGLIYRLEANTGVINNMDLLTAQFRWNLL